MTQSKLDCMPELKVDILHALTNFLDTYDYPPSEAVVVESIANSLDEKATKIELRLDEQRSLYELKDNGGGMSKEVFENYHVLALSSKEKGEGIGFAGVGSKIYLAASPKAEIITHTKGVDGPLASRIYRVGETVKWDPIEPHISETGTIYQVRVTPEDFSDLTRNIEKYIRKWFNPILLGKYGDVEIVANGARLLPWRPTLKLPSKEGRFQLRNLEYRYDFWICDEELSEEKQGIEIIVFGKRIKTKLPHYIFQVKESVRNKLHGYFLADDLARFLKTDKQDFKVNWAINQTISKMESLLYEWLERENLVTGPISETGAAYITNELTLAIQRVLNRVEFKQFNPWLSLVKSQVLVPQTEGGVASSEVSGSQVTDGTVGGPTEGGGVDVLGDEEGKALAQDSKGTKGASEKERKVRSFAFLPQDFPDDPREGWVAPEHKALVVNTAHPMYAATARLGLNGTMLNILRVLVTALITHRLPTMTNLDPQAVLDYQSKMITESWLQIGK